MTTSKHKISGALLTLLEQDSDGAALLSRRLYRAVRTAVLNATLKPGDRLPSTRALATDLSISRSTAEAAYRQLEEEGFLCRAVGDGSYVSGEARMHAAATTAKARRALALPSPALSQRGQQIARMGGCVDPREVRAFSAGLPALESFPMQIWLRLLARRVRRDGNGWMMYGDRQGLPQLRVAIAQYLSLSRGVECDADQVIVLTSSQQALILVASMLLDPGDAVWLEDPGYRGAQTAFAAAGARIVPVPLDADGMRVDLGLRHAPAARLAYVTPSHQYPLGMTLSLARRLQLIEWSRSSNAWIVEDDYDSEFHYDSRPIAAIHGLDPHRRVLYVGTFSKVLFPGARLAYLVVPKPLVDAFVTARSQLDGHTAPLMQGVLADFMQDGHFMAHVRRMRELYRARRDIFMEEIGRHLHGRLAAQVTHGGLQAACLLSDQRLSDARLADRAAQYGLELPTLSRLCLGPEKLQGFVMGFSALTPAEIRNGMKRLADALAG